MNLVLYGLKQFGRLWYIETLLVEHDFRNVSLLLCMFVKRFGDEFAIIAVYVDDLNTIGADAALSAARDCMTQDFEMELGKTT